MQNSLTLLKELNKRNPGQDFRILDLDAFQAVSHWYFFAIRELVALGDFRENPDWIAKRLRFKVKPEKIRDALETLLRLGLLARGPGGKLVMTSSHLDTEFDRADEGMTRYHEQVLELAGQALRELGSSEREISGGCFTMRSSDLAKVKERIRAFQMELCHEFENQTGDQVFQMEMAFFPLSKAKETP